MEDRKLEEEDPRAAVLLQKVGSLCSLGFRSGLGS